MIHPRGTRVTGLVLGTATAFISRASSVGELQLGYGTRRVTTTAEGNVCRTALFHTDDNIQQTSGHAGHHEAYQS